MPDNRGKSVYREEVKKVQGDFAKLAYGKGRQAKKENKKVRQAGGLKKRTPSPSSRNLSN